MELGKQIDMNSQHPTMTLCGCNKLAKISKSKMSNCGWKKIVLLMFSNYEIVWDRVAHKIIIGGERRYELPIFKTDYVHGHHITSHECQQT